MAKILITGGSGLIGKVLSELFVNRGHKPVWLSREPGQYNSIKKYKWDPDRGYLDERAFEGVEYIVHLAGAGIVDKRWTENYKQQIIDSRVKSGELLFEHIDKNNYPIKAFAGASAVGYYGARQNNNVFTEDDFPGTDFLAKTCVLWEKSYEPFSRSGIRTAVIRTGMVLSREDGLYKKLAPLFKYGLGDTMGSGRQYMPWIHVSDLAALYAYVLFTEPLSGPYNAVSSERVTNAEFSEQLAQSFHKPLRLLNIPTFALALALGESAVTITEGLKISNQKAKDSGFTFRFETLADALNDLRG